MRHLDVLQQKLSPHCLAIIFDSQVLREELPQKILINSSFALAKFVTKNVSRLNLFPFELHFLRKEDKQNFTKHLSQQNPHTITRKIPAEVLLALFWRQVPSPKLSPKMPPKLSLAREGSNPSFKITPAVRIIVRQLRDKIVSRQFLSRDMKMSLLAQWDAPQLNARILFKHCPPAGRFTVGAEMEMGYSKWRKQKGGGIRIWHLHDSTISLSIARQATVLSRKNDMMPPLVEGRRLCTHSNHLPVQCRCLAVRV